MDVDRGQRVYPTPEDIAIVMGLHELANGLEATSLDAYGGTTAFAYDAAGNLVQSTDALGRTTWKQYDAIGNVVKSRMAPGEIVRRPRHCAL